MCYVAEVREPVLGHRWPLIDLGLERAGMECAWQVEIDPFCRKVLAKHWPNVPKYGDIRGVTGDELEQVDVVCGGFPCQPVSLAGKQRGQEDERWLWSEFCRLLGVLRPRYVLIENVPGLYDRGLSDVLAGLAALGYDAEWESISAATFGAPHVRERLFIVAHAASVRCFCGKFFDRRDDLPYYQGWDAAKGNRGWDSWQRWFNEVGQTGIVAHSDREGQQDAQRGTRSPEPYWRPIVGANDAQHRLERGTPEPLILGMDDGLPSTVDRLRGLGNAVVPQVAQFIGERIIAAAAAESVTP